MKRVPELRFKLYSASEHLKKVSINKLIKELHDKTGHVDENGSDSQNLIEEILKDSK